MKEEQKQYIIDIMKKDEELGLYDIFNDGKRQGVKELIDKHKQESFVEKMIPLQLKYNLAMLDVMKQESLEEAAKGYSERHQDVSGNLGKYLVSAVFQDGAKWQQERMYSEEDMNDYANYRLLIKKALSPKEWFEQFKKK